MSDQCPVWVFTSPSSGLCFVVSARAKRPSARVAVSDVLRQVLSAAALCNLYLTRGAGNNPALVRADPGFWPAETGEAL